LKKEDAKISFNLFKIMMLKTQKLGKVYNYFFKNKGFDMNKVPMANIFKYWELEKNTIDFIGHAIALYYNDDFLKRPAIECI